MGRAPRAEGGLGREAYEAFGQAIGWRDGYGIPMPGWDQLPEKTRDGWHAVAARITELVT